MRKILFSKFPMTEYTKFRGLYFSFNRKTPRYFRIDIMQHEIHRVEPCPIFVIRAENWLVCSFIKNLKLAYSHL